MLSTKRRKEGRKEGRKGGREEGRKGGREVGSIGSIGSLRSGFNFLTM